MVFGDQPNVGAVSLMPSMGPDDIRAKIEECISSFDDQDQVLILPISGWYPVQPGECRA